MPQPEPKNRILKRWHIEAQHRPMPPETARALAAYPPLMQRLLFNRHLHTAADAEAFLKARPSDDDDPLQLAGMGPAVERIERALRNREPIAVYGDYDTDGVTSTALLVQVLAALGADVRAYIPNRFDEGYGLNAEALDVLQAEGRRLVITVDCGIRSVEEAVHARKIGLDLIISDHHTVGEQLPPALAIVNPKQAGETYAYKDFAGVGLAYKMAQALVRRRSPQPINGSDVLDLVALGTVADLAPLTGENRALVRKGLGLINKPRREGLKSLILQARLKPGSIDAGNIGFALGPRLNAAGRLESAQAAYRLLTTTDVFEAGQLAGQLEQQNRERQDLTRQITAQARQMALESDPEAMFIFAAHESFNAGVVGLAAARLVEEFYRPTAVACIGPDVTKGSARSIKEFHVTQAFDHCAELLLRHGGHAAAAGFTVANENVGELAARLRQYAGAALAGEDLRPALRVDAAVELKDLDLELARMLQDIEPCGYGNPAPVFAMYGVEPKHPRKIGADGAHLKLLFSDGRSTLDAIAFRQAHWHDNMPRQVDVAFGLEVNEWQGERRLQLNVKDIRPTMV